MTSNEMQQQPPLLTIDGKPLSEAVPFSVDSAYIANFDQLSLFSTLRAQFMRGAASVYEHLASTGAFIDRDDPSMTYRGRPIKRTKFFAVRARAGCDKEDDDDDDLAHLPAHVPIYKYPGFQYESTLQYVNLASMPFVNALVEQLEQRATYKGVPLTINHVIGTHYVTGEDNIGFHSDKAEDIQADSPILMFSFGGRRELWFREVAGDDKGEKDEKDSKDDSGATSSAKKSGAATSTTEKNGGGENKNVATAATTAATSTAKKQAIVQKFVMEPGSLFVLGPETNRLLQHSIVPESDETCTDREKEPLQPRISLVARHISTVLSRRELRCRIDASVRGKMARAAAKQRKAQEKEQAQEKEIAERHGAKGTGQKRKRQGDK